MLNSTKADAVYTADPDRAFATGADERASARNRQEPLEAWWWNLATLILVLAAVVRLYSLDLKPLHHDEGVNGLILSDLINPPHVYRYNPANYHGPTLYYFAWLSTSAVGVTTFSLRFVTAIFGIATIILILNARNHIGRTAALAAAALIAVSPGAVYYSRYFIHETLLGFFTVATFVAALSYRQTGRPSRLWLASAAAALMFATKETALITAVVFTASAVGTWLYFRWRRMAVGSSQNPPATFSRAERRRLPWLAVCASAIFVGLNVFFYTSFFTHPEGMIAALQSFLPWGSTGLQQHTHPWITYLSWLVQEEFPVLLLGAAGAALALWRANNAVAVLAALWALGTTAAYSLIPYKTPWLTLNMVLPLAMVGGYAVDTMRESRHVLARRVALLATIAALALSAYQAVVLNFVRYDDDRYPYVYAHTDRDVLQLVQRVDQVMQRAAGARPTAAITSVEYFPLNWYFRRYPVGYYSGSTDVTDPIIIGSLTQDETLRRKFGASYERFGPYVLRPGVTLVLYVRRDLVDR